MATVAVAASTASGVCDTWIPSNTSVSTNFISRDKGKLTSLRGSIYIDLVVTSAVVADVFDRLRQMFNQVGIKHSNRRSRIVVPVDGDQV